MRSSEDIWKELEGSYRREAAGRVTRKASADPGIVRGMPARPTVRKPVVKKVEAPVVSTEEILKGIENEPTMAEVEAMATELGRKFEAEDVDVPLRFAAIRFLESLGTERKVDAKNPASGFLFDMVLKVKGGESLSPGMVKGVLNCMVAEVRFQARQAEREAREAEARERIVVTTPGQPAPEGKVTDGMYLHNGQIVKVQKAVHGSGNLYAKVLRTDEFGSAEFEYRPGLIRELKVSERMSLEQAKEYGALYGVCVRCARTLTDERSIEAAMGPVCRKAFDW